VIYVELRADGDVRGDLQGLAQVEAVHVLGRDGGTSMRLRLEAAPGSDVRERVFHTAVERGWTLLEMRRETRSFEDVFRELTMSPGAEPQQLEKGGGESRS
jgi:hypothetical protein